MRWGLAIRSLVVALPLVWIGLQFLNSGTFASTACLTALWITMADFRRPAVHSYVQTAAAVVVATVIGSIPMSPILTVVTVVVVTAWLGIWRGFGGFASSAGVIVTSALLVAVGLRVAGQQPTMIVLGVLTGATAAAVVGIIFASKDRRLLIASQDVSTKLVAILNGERPDSDAQGLSEKLMTNYVTSADRPQAPTRKSAAFATRLSALGRISDLVAKGTAADDPAIRHACAQRLAGGTDPVAYDGPDLWTLGLVAATESAVTDPPISRGEWRRQLQVRLRPDSMLFTQALFVSLLYGSLTALVMFANLNRPHWVLLGAVSASYPYARQAAFVLGNMLLATVAAFGVLLVFAAVASEIRSAWWPLLSIAVILACGAPTTRVGKLVGQTSFTVVSLCLLAISLGGISGQDIEVRFEDVLIGGCAAMVMALALAPRHLRQRLESALSGTYSSAAKAVFDPVDGLDVCRAQFLRCTDAMESIRGTKFITTEHLVAWLDAARSVVQIVVAAGLAQRLDIDAQRQNEAVAAQCRRRARELSDNVSITGYDPPAAHSGQEAQLRATYDMLLANQRQRLSDLTPLLPREYFSKET